MTLQLHLIILGAVVVLLAVAAVLTSLRFRAAWAERKGKKHPEWTYKTWDRSDLPSFWFKWSAVGAASFMALVLVISLVPFNPTYWVLTQHQGIIASISNSFVDGTGDISGSTYTLTLEGDRTPRVVVDSRILGLEVGDRVDLTCSLEWVYGGADINNCYLHGFLDEEAATERVTVP
jgi:hypothetical protein